jgi:hypothetical protein
MLAPPSAFFETQVIYLFCMDRFTTKTNDSKKIEDEGV